MILEGKVVLPSLATTRLNAQDDVAKLRDELLPLAVIPDAWKKDRKDDKKAAEEDRAAATRQGLHFSLSLIFISHF
jgi:hypothetical protein